MSFWHERAGVATSESHLCREMTRLFPRMKCLKIFVLFLHMVPLQCKLVLSTNPSELFQNKRSKVEIVKSSLGRFDSFTVCWRFLTYTFSVSTDTDITPYGPHQYLLTYHEMLLLGIFQTVLFRYMIYL